MRKWQSSEGRKYNGCAGLREWERVISGGERGNSQGRGGKEDRRFTGVGWWAVKDGVTEVMETKVEEVGGEVRGGGRMAAQRSNGGSDGGGGGVGMSAQGNT